MATSAPVSASTDTVIVGWATPHPLPPKEKSCQRNGPSALILSYLLHGNIPCYTPSQPHPDSLLHKKLVGYSDLLGLDVGHVTNHFEASDFSYSNQSLPINVLLDALVRPGGDAATLPDRSKLSWKHQPERAVPHLVIGNATSPGGQWVENPVNASWNIGTLSYADMLSLPGYSFAEHYLQTSGKALPPFTRPSRSQVTEYFQQYPHKVRIDDAICCQQTVSGVARTETGFYIKSHNLTCRNLVLASGVFSELILAPALLQPLLRLPGPSNLCHCNDASLLVVGSGFSAADVINSSPPEQSVIHIYHWSPSTSPSPLRACHQQAYPEYAGVYRQMKQAARDISTTAPTRPGHRPKARRRSNTASDLSRDWPSKYEGLPNATITDVKVEDETAQITIRKADGQTIQRRISRLEYVVGRRGSLNYLCKDLRREIHPSLAPPAATVSGHTLRDRVLDDIEVAPHVFAIGSLTGDSLIRFALGSAVYTAGKIMAYSASAAFSSSSTASTSTSTSTSTKSLPHTHTHSPQTTDNAHEPANNPSPPARPTGQIMIGLDGHHDHGRRNTLDNEDDDNNNQ